MKKSVIPYKTRNSVQRIVHLVHRLDLSGVAVHLRNLGLGLQAQGCKVAVAARDIGGEKDFHWYRKIGFSVFKVEFPKTNLQKGNLTAVFRSIQQLKRLCDEFQPDVLHIHAATLVPFARWVAAQHRLPIVTTFHIEQIGLLKRMLGKTSKLFLRRPFGESTVAISSEMKKILVNKIGIPESRITLIPPSPDDRHFRKPTMEERYMARKKFKLTKEQPVVCKIAMLEPRKNHGMLLRAIAVLRRRGLEVAVLCAGSGSKTDIQRIQRLSRDLKIQDLVHLVGQQESRSILWASDVNVLTSIKEGFGMAVVEGMLCGRVAVRTPSAGAYDQIQDGDNGYIVGFDNDQALANRIQYIITNSAARWKLECNAVRYARKNFTINNMAGRMLETYRNAQQLMNK